MTTAFRQAIRYGAHQSTRQNPLPVFVQLVEGAETPDAFEARIEGRRSGRAISAHTEADNPNPGTINGRTRRQGLEELTGRYFGVVTFRKAVMPNGLAGPFLIHKERCDSP